MIAALYVATGGCYYGLDDVDPWDEARDARTYAGPHPVVAHPPCARWGRYWYGGPMLHKQGRRTKLGDDDGCFAAALASVRAHGGVLEHPADSHAWRVFGLVAPPRSGGWIPAGIDHLAHDGVSWTLRKVWTCCVSQGHYGHRAGKPTWLFAALPPDVAPPSLTWGPSSSCKIDTGYHTAEEAREARQRQRLGTMSGGPRNGFLERMSKTERLATPVAFRDILITMARSARKGTGTT